MTAKGFCGHVSAERFRPVVTKALLQGARSVISLLSILALISSLTWVGAARAEDDALTAAEIRALIANMDDAGNPPACDAAWSSDMCSTRQAERKRCLALREKILGNSGDFVVRPVMQTDKYEQGEFDKYAGKCRGAEFNKTYALFNYSNSWMIAESTSNLRLYVIKSFGQTRDNLLVFGRNYGIALEPYQKREIEKRKAEGKHWEASPGQSFFSRVNYKDCRIHEIHQVAEPGPLALGSPYFVEYGKASIILVGRQYYIVDHHKYSNAQKGTLSIIKVDERILGNAEHCAFQ